MAYPHPLVHPLLLLAALGLLTTGTPSRATVAPEQDRTSEELADIGVASALFLLDAVSLQRTLDHRPSRTLSLLGLALGAGAIAYGMNSAELEGLVAASGAGAMAIGLLGSSHRADPTLRLRAEAAPGRARWRPGVRISPGGRAGAAFVVSTIF
ncbi:MAG: hypothetical protein KC729_05465 [Candidatus Eisenbacteria bacterium]|uniref:Uncharacterized protein n=1 Tax=Eiseniibacteriota bacterium TaxID=2212470 RepID=A0A956LXG1_UNCEI|nr:hypothetical protein [Candidatus Eisenbacteria bacterium]